jgi:hypothetical protein
VLAAWFIFVVAVWPILTVVVAFASLTMLMGVCAAFYPPSAQEGCAMFMSLGILGFVFALSPIAAAIACYKACRLITVPLSESKPLAFEGGAVIAVITAMLVAFFCWAWIWVQAWTVT